MLVYKPFCLTINAQKHCSRLSLSLCIWPKEPSYVQAHPRWLLYLQTSLCFPGAQVKVRWTARIAPALCGSALPSLNTRTPAQNGRQALMAVISLLCALRSQPSSSDNPICAGVQPVPRVQGWRLGSGDCWRWALENSVVPRAVRCRVHALRVLLPELQSLLP